MIFVLLIIAVSVFLTVYPTMWAAKKCGADNYGFFPCLWAIVFGFLLAAFLSLGIHDFFIYIVIVLLSMALTLKFFLSTKFIQSFVIALIAWVINVFVTYLMSGFTGIPAAQMIFPNSY